MSQRDTIDQAIWKVVATIPKGKVMAYGEVARRAGLPRGARRVGPALGRAPEAMKLPWHRVLGAGGKIAFPRDHPGYQRQVDLLSVDGLLLVKGKVAASDVITAQSMDELLWG